MAKPSRASFPTTCFLFSTTASSSPRPTSPPTLTASSSLAPPPPSPRLLFSQRPRCLAPPPPQPPRRSRLSVETLLGIGSRSAAAGHHVRPMSDSHHQLFRSISHEAV